MKIRTIVHNRGASVIDVKVWNKKVMLYPGVEIQIIRNLDIYIRTRKQGADVRVLRIIGSKYVGPHRFLISKNKTCKIGKHIETTHSHE